MRHARVQSCAGAPGRVRASAARHDARRWDNPCVDQNHSRDTRHAVSSSTGRDEPWRVSKPPRWPGSSGRHRSRSRRVPENPASGGARLPSIWTRSGRRRSPANARDMASMVACRMFSASISACVAMPIDQSSALPLDALHQRLTPRRSSTAWNHGHPQGPGRAPAPLRPRPPRRPAARARPHRCRPR